FQTVHKDMDDPLHRICRWALALEAGSHRLLVARHDGVDRGTHQVGMRGKVVQQGATADLRAALYFQGGGARDVEIDQAPHGGGHDARPRGGLLLLANTASFGGSLILVHWSVLVELSDSQC